ncbi:hypothetical protein Tco_1577464 [Tanacetum coccineum]
MHRLRGGMSMIKNLMQKLLLLVQKLMILLLKLKCTSEGVQQRQKIKKKGRGFIEQKTVKGLKTAGYRFTTAGSRLMLLLKRYDLGFILYMAPCAIKGVLRSPVLWAKIGEGSLIGPELVQETTDKVVVIKEKLKAAIDRQKSYADNRRKPLEFEVGDRVMLKVSPWKGVIRFGKKGKLASRCVGPFEILENIG